MRNLCYILMFIMALATPAAAQAPAAPAIRGMDFDIYIRLQTGMSEGELLQRAGNPDQWTVDNLQALVVKSYYYLPTTANPYITVITLRGGRVANIERTKKF